VLAACFSAGCGDQAGGAAAPPRPNLRRGVDLAQAQRRSLDYEVELVGNVEAESQTNVPAGVSGIVDEVFFREGDHVTPDTLLMTIDQKRYTAALDVTKANEDRARENLALARDQNERVKAAPTTFSREEATRYALLERIADAEHRRAQAERGLAENNLRLSRVKPRYTGQINQKLVTPGTYVEEKTTIATMADLTKLRVVIWVPESDARLVRALYERQAERIKNANLALSLGVYLAGPAAELPPVALHLVARNQSLTGFDPEFTTQGTGAARFRTRIFYMATVGSSETHMFECKAEIVGYWPESGLRPGNAARIRFPLRTNANACVIPEEATRATERGFVVFVPEKRAGKDGKEEWVARERVLDLGARSPGWVEVKSGLRPGDWFVHRGADALENGTPIAFKQTIE
jgi:RND family efflux transporter MFP subunit